jgi:predicted O-methyltransferase YrrM
MPILDNLVSAMIRAARRSGELDQLLRDVAARVGARDHAGAPATAAAPTRQGLFEFRYASGHYYSPIPSYDDIERDEARIFDRSLRKLPGVDIDDGRMREWLTKFAPFAAEYPYTETPDPALRFALDNPTYSRGDAIVLYGMMRANRPARIVEIGSGRSTWLMLDVNERFFDNRIRITTVDPYPSSMREGLHAGDEGRLEVVAKRIQDADVAMFGDLRDGDILLVDSTHVSKCDSDVNRIVLEILPTLRPGVLVHFHDVFWPFEYPKHWLLEIGVAWNEIYQLRAFLQFNSAYRIEFFSDYAGQFLRPEIEASIPPFLHGVGSSLWLRRV